jgi:predicted MFS family arabinose efflux permease
VLGPALGGLAYTTLGATWCFTLNGISYIAVIITLFMIQVKFVPPTSRPSVLKSMGEGIRFIRQREGLGPLVVLAFSTTLLGFSITGFLPVIVQTIFHKGPETYQLLLICSGAGSIAGALMVAGMERLKGQGHIALLTLLVLGATTVGFSLSHWLPLSCVLIFFGGAAIMSSASLMLSLVQVIVSDNMRGRVLSVYNLAFRAGIPLGSLAIGRLIPLVGVSWALAGSGAILIALSLYFLIVMRNIATFQHVAST